MNQEQFKNISKSKLVQDKVKKFSKEKSKKIISEIKKKSNSTKHQSIETGLIDTKLILETLCERPTGLTEVRRDGKDNNAVVVIIQQEFKRCEEKGMSDSDLTTHMQSFASASWVCAMIIDLLFDS